MKRFRSNIMAQFFSFMAALLMVLPLGAGPVLGAEEAIKATTNVKHKSAKYFVPENRIKLDATVKDKAGVNLVRCYFRALGQADFVFVAMAAAEKDLFEGILPAPSKDTETIEYLFLAVNGENHVVKTQAFEIHKKDDDAVPAWQQVSSDGKITVSTELAHAPTAPPGFSDSIAMDVVESGSRFGVVAGLYDDSSVLAAGGITGAAAGAASAGIIVASAGLGTAGWVALGALAVGGGAVAASSGGGDDDPAPATVTPSGTGGLSDVTVSQRNITLRAWDDQAVDGDQVDIILNGTTLRNNLVLEGPPGTSINLPLVSGSNTLVVHADNQGSSGPNTAAVEISDVTSGSSSQSWNLSTGEDATMNITAP